MSGGNAGIGKALAIELAKRDARIIIASRNLAKSNQARLEIIKHSGNQNVNEIVFNRTEQINYIAIGF